MFVCLFVLMFDCTCVWTRELCSRMSKCLYVYIFVCVCVLVREIERDIEGELVYMGV